MVHHGRRAARRAQPGTRNLCGRPHAYPFTGVGTALITPFTKDGALDEAAVKRLAERQIDAGVHFLLPCRHHRRIADAEPRREAARGRSSWSKRPTGRVPVLAGAGGYATSEAIELSREMEKAGADGLLGRRPTTTSRRRKACTSTSRRSPRARRCPIVLYNVPGRTGVNIDVATVEPARGDPEHRRHQGSVGRPRPDVRARGGRTRESSWC